MAGLYVHIPYCAAKCAYCDFYSGPLRGFDPEAYIDAAMRELLARRDEVISADEKFATIYIGGGTPSSIDPGLLAPFCDLVETGAEATVEANPEDVTSLWADGAMAAGFNRVSMGVQSLVDEELKAIGRRHSAKKAIEAVHTLRRAGFDNISLDLIYGLPGQTLESWLRSLRGVLELHPEHLSAYLLSYEPGTRLYAMLNAGKISEADEGLVNEMYAILCDEARKHGYEHYEISNFGLPGHLACHNSSYWDFTPYIGIGPGAHSFDGVARRYNPSDLKSYMANPESSFEIEDQEPQSRHNEMVITSLRTAKGIDPHILSDKELATAAKLLVPAADGRLRIAEEKWLLSNPIMESFIRI